MKGLNGTRERRETLLSSGGYVRAANGSAPIDGRGYLALLSRRKWIIIPFLIFLPLAAYVYAAQATPVYEASAQVFLNRQSQTLFRARRSARPHPERVIRTQADIARLPVIAERVVEKAGLERRRGDVPGAVVGGLERPGRSSHVQVRDEVPSRARVPREPVRAGVHPSFVASSTRRPCARRLRRSERQIRELEEQGRRS